MYISYLDGSGRPSFSDKEDFVLASLTVNEKHWNYIDNHIKVIKLQHFPDIPDEEIEIHAKDLVNKHGIFESVSWDEIYSLLDDVFNFISENSTSIVIHASLLRKDKIYNKKSFDIEVWAYRLLLERLNHYMSVENSESLKSKSYFQYCILLTDSEDMKKDQKLRIRLIDMLRNGTFYSKLKYLFEEPMFVNSKLRNLSQLVDCVAYCIRKHFRTCTPSEHNTHWERYFKLIEPKIYAPYDTNIGYGLKILKKKVGDSQTVLCSCQMKYYV